MLFTSTQGCSFSAGPATETAEILRTEGQCGNVSCVEIRVLPPSIPIGLTPKAADAARTALARELFDDGSGQAKSDFDADRFSDGLIEEYRRIPAGQRGGTWRIIRKAELLFSNPSVATWRIEKSDTFGAPHPLESVRFLSLNLVDGSPITWSQILQPDKDKVLLDLISFEIRGARKIPVGQGFTDSGLAVSDRDRLLLEVGSIGVTADGIRVHYDPYDIGAYSLGATTFTLSPLALRAVIRHDLAVVRHLLQ